MVWRDKCDVYILTFMHNPPTDGNFCDKHGYAVKPRIIKDYNGHMDIKTKGTE
jgi:hypothetical protein